MPNRAETGQAAVESALTIPMMVFALLGILQVVMGYHARILNEYAAFKVARAASVYRATCRDGNGRSVLTNAALMALLPSMGSSVACPWSETQSASGSPDLTSCTKQKYSAIARDVLNKNRTRVGTPIVLVKYYVTNQLAVPKFDLPLTGGTPMKVHVKLAYFYEYRIPVVNWMLAKYWLAMQTGVAWASRDPIMLTTEANQPPVSSTMDSEILSWARVAIQRGYMTTPIVSSFTMRMMSDVMPDGAPSDEGGAQSCAL
jgi:hypothetical protein